jgi:tetratricopeptide (TPR) repeat protein
MRISILLAGGTLLLAFAGPGLAASQRDWDDCKANASDPDGSISGCTRIINGGAETTHNRALAYVNRAGAYLNKGDNDRAIADASEAIRLDPKIAAAYVIRAGAYSNKGDNDRGIAP